MKFLDFALLRGGFTPAELGLPDSVLDGAGTKPLSVEIPLYKPLYTTADVPGNRKGDDVDS